MKACITVETLKKAKSAINKYGYVTVAEFLNNEDSASAIKGTEKDFINAFEKSKTFQIHQIVKDLITNQVAIINNDGIVYINEGKNISNSTLLKYFSLPFLQLIQKENKEVFDKLLTDLDSVMYKEMLEKTLTGLTGDNYKLQKIANAIELSGNKRLDPKTGAILSGVEDRFKNTVNKFKDGVNLLIKNTISTTDLKEGPWTLERFVDLLLVYKGQFDTKTLVAASVNPVITDEKIDEIEERSEIISIDFTGHTNNEDKTKSEDDGIFGINSEIDDISFDRTINTIIESSPITKQEEEWFNKIINTDGTRLQISNLVNSNAWATWTKAGVTLYSNAPSGTLYHEAWHEFSQLYLLDNQINKLYKEALGTLSKKDKDIYNNLNENDQKLFLEEFIAEDFRIYMQTGNSSIIKENKTIFEKIKDFLNKLFGQITIERAYKDLKDGNLNKYQRSMNSYFGSLNRSAYLFDSLNQDSDKIVQSFFDHLDVSYTEFALGSNLDYTDKEALKQFNTNVFKHIYKEFENIQKLLLKNPDLHQDKLNIYNILINGKKLLNSGNEVSNFNVLVSEYILEKNLKLDRTQGEEYIDLLNEEGTAEEGEINELDKIRNPFENDNQNDSFADASIALREAVTNLPEINKRGDKFVKSFNTYGFVNKADSVLLWKVMLDELAGMDDIEEMLKKVDSLSDTYPSLKRLIELLGGISPNTITLPLYLRRGDFYKVFSRSHVERYISLFNPKNGSQKLVKGTNKAEDHIFQDWKDNFENSIYAYKGVNGVKFLDNQFLSDFPFYSIEIPKRMKEFPELLIPVKAKRIEFLNALGIKLNEATLKSPEMDLILRGLTGETFDIIEDIHKWITTMVIAGHSITSDIGIGNIIEDILQYAEFENKKGDKIYGRKKDLRKLAELEQKYNSVYFEPSIYNASNKPEYENQLNNYLTFLSNVLNDTKYSTLNEIFEQEEYAYLNPEVNPIIEHSLVLQRMFRKDENGIYNRVYEKGKPIEFKLISYNGLDIRSDKELDINEKGAVTTKLNAFDKLIMDINNGLNEGIQENLRTGDKSSAYAFKMSSWGNNMRTPISLESAAGLSLRAVNNTLSEGGTYMRGLLLDEIKRIKLARQNKLGSKVYDNKAKTFVIFDSLLTDAIKEDLYTIIDNSMNPDVASKMAEEYILGTKGKDISNSIYNYFRSKDKSKPGRADLLENYLRENGLSLFEETNEYEESQLNLTPLFGDIKFKNGNNLTLSQIVDAYSSIAFILNVENMRLVYGDLAFYKDPFKRFSGFSATGVMARVDNETNKLFRFDQNIRKQTLQNAAENNNLDSLDLSIINKLKTVVFKDVTNVSQFYEKIRENLVRIKEKEGLSKEDAQKYVDSLDILEAYRGDFRNGEYVGYAEPDAQAVCTLEFYREASIRTNTWTNKQEKVFVKILANQPISLEEMALFPARKDQYTGGLVNDLGIFVPALHKYSIIPLIPQAIVDTPYEKLNKKMLDQGIGYATFESGSKIETLTGNSGLNSFYNEDGDFTTEDLVVNEIYWKFLKNQVEIAPKMKEENTFGTQYRKLLFQDKFSMGIPLDYKLDNWWDLNTEQKRKASKIFELYDDYNQMLKDITNGELDKLKNELGITFENGKYKITKWNSLKDMIKQEIIRRDLPSSVLDVFQTIKKGSKENVELKLSNLEASKNKMLVEQLLFSIVNNRLVTQKVFGDALIQGALTGFEKMSTKQKFKEKGYSKDLAFYRADPETGKTLGMQVKVSFDINKHLPLLRLKFEGNTFERNSLEESVFALNNVLNKARLDDTSKEAKWFKNNKKFFTMVGYRIPTQGLNSIELMEIVEFLPTTMANTIIVPSEIVVSAGSDFDVDKLNIFQYKITDSESSGPIILNKKGSSNNPKVVYSNRLLDLAVDVLSMEETFEGLITPNSTNIIKDQIADVIKSRVGKRTGEFNLSKSPTLVLDPLNILEQFNAFLSGKETLGIAALANTFTQLYQSVGAYLNTEVKEEKETKKILYFLKHRKINVKGVNHIDYSNSYTLDGVKKSELFSQFINAYVDIAKEPFIFYMNAGKMVAPLVFHMIQMGTPMKDIANFINQPIIRDYIKILDRKNSSILRAGLKATKNDLFTDNFKNSVLDSLVDKYGAGDFANKDFKSVKKMALKRLEEVSDSFFEKSSEYLDKDLELPVSLPNTDSKVRQVLYLVQFEELIYQSGLLRDITGTLNFDTKKTTGIIDMTQRIENLNKFSNNDSIFSKEIYNRLKTTTPIQSYNQFELLEGLFSNLFPISSSKKVLGVLNNIKNTLKSNGTFNMEVSERVNKMFYNQLISFIIQNGIIENNTFVNNLFNQYQPMLSGNNNIGIRLNEIKDLFSINMPNSKESRFIDLFVKKESKSTNLVTIEYNGDRLTGRLIDSYEEMFENLLTFEHSNKEFADKVRTFFNDLIPVSLIQNGISKTGTSFNELIPTQRFNDVVRPLVNNFIQNIESNSNQLNLFNGFLNNFAKVFFWNNGQLIGNKSSRGNGNFKEYKLQILGREFKTSGTVLLKSSSVIDINKNFSVDLLGGDIPGTANPASATLNLYEKSINETVIRSAWQNIEAVDVHGASLNRPDKRFMSNEELFKEGKKTALTIPKTIVQKDINGEKVNTIKIANTELKEGDIVFLGHTFDKYRITRLVDLASNLNDYDVLMDMAKREYVNPWYFTSKDINGSYLKHSGLSGTQIQFEKVIEKVEVNFDYINAYTSNIPGEFYRIRNGNKRQLTLEVNRPLKEGDTLLIKENENRNSNIIQVIVTRVQEINLYQLMSDTDLYTQYLQAEKNQEYANLADNYRRTVRDVGNGVVKVINFKLLNEGDQNKIPKKEKDTSNEANDIVRMIGIRNIGNFFLKTNNKFYDEKGNEITNENRINMLRVNLAAQDGSLRQSEYNNSSYYILPDNSIIGTGKTNYGKASIKNQTIIDKIIETATSYKPTDKNC